MAKITLNNISSGYLVTTIVNANMDAIEEAFENTLSRDGTTPNTMLANLDMNSHKLLNCGEATTGDEYVTLSQVTEYSSTVTLAVINSILNDESTINEFRTVFLEGAEFDVAVEASLSNFTVPSTIWIPGGAMFPYISPLSGPQTFAVARNQVSGGTEASIPQFVNLGLAIGDSVGFDVAFPKGWDLGTITFRPYWMIASTGAITGTKAKFELSGVSNADNEALDDVFGTAVGVEQTTTSPTGYKLFTGSESSSVTIAGTLADGELCQFKVKRVAASSSDITDNLVLRGIKIFFNTKLTDV